MINKIEKVEKVICDDCKLEKNLDRDFYLLKGERMKICKDCFAKEILNSKDIFEVFKKYDMPFIMHLWDKAQLESGDFYLAVGNYMKYIYSLPQYRGLR
jgi:hypothetical protein